MRFLLTKTKVTNQANMFIDTHAHIYLDEFKEEWDTMAHSFSEAGIDKVYLPNIDADSISDVNALADLHPNTCIPMMGLHPCYVKEDVTAQLEKIEAQLDRRTYAAIGEIGIDLHWDLSHVKEQQEAFEQQIKWALSRNMPIVIHSRKSLEETISTVEKYQDGTLTGIFHCFNGTIDQVQRIVELGFYMGLGGVITFKNAKLDEMVRAIPQENIVLETDAPYLSPHPNRGKRNTPMYLPIIAQKVADIRGETLEMVGKYTSGNSMNLFN